MKNSVLIIAEAGVNHNGSIDTAKKLIDEAKNAGADYVKFQTFKAANLVTKAAKKAEYQIANTSDSGEDNQFQMLKALELSLDDHLELISYCKEKNIKFLSTAFDLESIDLLSNLNIDLFKIPSGEITNLPYLKKIGKSGKKVILSTGMCTLEDIESAIAVLAAQGVNRSELVVLHCNTEYPTPYEDVNLRAIKSIESQLGVATGYSDHTPGIEVPIAAVALGAIVIEKHFTLDRNMPGPDHKASLEPSELKQMVTAIRNIENSLGSGIKQPSPSEVKNMTNARKSIHLSRDMKRGELIQEEDLVMKRPGDGISPMKMETIIGRKLLFDLPYDHKLELNNLSE
jgi:N,N'-diacetyllegionaminate synthase